MSQFPNAQGPTNEIKPQANVYTVLVFAAILVLGITAGFLIFKMTQPVADGGYGLQFAELFDPLTDPLKGSGK